MPTKIISLLLSTTAICAATVAFAQDAAPPPAATQEAPTDVSGTMPIEEVVVTAQRRQERLVDVPISVTVIKGDDAKAAGVLNTRDLSQVVPGLIGGQAGYSFQPSIRGITSTGTGAGDESNVALYVDGVYIASMGATAFNLGDIDHVEVSKGPQGTLFGRNATGGAIQVVTRTPTAEPTLDVSGSFGFTGAQSKEITAYGSTGITDDLAVSLSGYYYDDNGYMNNVDPNYHGPKQGATNTYNVRLKALYTPINNLEVTAALDYGRSRSGVELTTTFLDNINGFKNVAGVLTSDKPWDVSTNEENLDRGLTDGGYLKIRYELGSLSLTSLSAFRKADMDVSLDNDRTNLALNRSVYGIDINTVSQEFTLNSNFEGPFNFIGGLYYFSSEATHPYYNIYAAKIGPVVDGVRNVISPIALTSSISGELDTHSYAAFGEGTYKITDQLSLVGGLRYSIDYKDASDVNLLNPALPEVDSSGNWSNLNYRVSLNYKPDPDSLLYFSTSTGFKSGFISISAYPYPNPQPSVKPEEVTAYEIGYKNEMFGNRLQLAASAFHYDYKDIQLTVNNALSAAAGTVGVNILENAARAKIYGADFDATGKLDEHWSAHFGISWLPTAEYSDFDGGISYVPAAGGLGAVAVASDLSGTRILRSPKTALDLGITYATDIEEGKLGTVQITGNYSRSGDFFMVIGEEAEQPAYSIFNLDVAWTDPSQKYTVALWGRNLGNEAYYLSGLANTGGFSAVWAKPREIGVRLSAAL